MKHTKRVSDIEIGPPVSGSPGVPVGPPPPPTLLNPKNEVDDKQNES